MVFYLGTHEPGWLNQTACPLFISRRRLARRKSLPRALGRWALDSGGFTELDRFGAWQTSPEQYADEAQRWQEGIGGLDFAAPQDWMCEPRILRHTGLTVVEHQRRTIESYLKLRELAPGVPWIPVLQGYDIPEYVDHAAQYQRAGIDLGSCARVGVGSVCRRQARWEAAELFADLWHLKLRLHGFGLKTSFLKHVFSCGLESFDSMAWSLRARKSRIVLPGCTHAVCNNCLRFALEWREQVCKIGKRPGQPLLF